MFCLGIKQRCHSFCYSPTLFRALSYRKALSYQMADRIGQTRSNPGSGTSSPISKKPRLETHVEAAITDRVKGQAIESPSTKKSARKEARKAKKKGLHIPPEPYSTEDVLWRDVESVLGHDIVNEAIGDGIEWDSPFSFREEVELTVHSLSSTGTCFRSSSPFIVQTL